MLWLRRRPTRGQSAASCDKVGKDPKLHEVALSGGCGIMACYKQTWREFLQGPRQDLAKHKTTKRTRTKPRFLSSARVTKAQTTKNDAFGSWVGGNVWEEMLTLHYLYYLAVFLLSCFSRALFLSHGVVSSKGLLIELGMLGGCCFECSVCWCNTPYLQCCLY